MICSRWDGNEKVRKSYREAVTDHSLGLLSLAASRQVRPKPFIKLRIEQLRAVRIKWITFAVDGWPVSPVLVAPEPLFRMLANERFKSVPTSLSDLFSASRRGELDKIKNMNRVTFRVCNGNERENPLFGSFLKHRVHHGCAHAQPEGA